MYCKSSLGRGKYLQLLYDTGAAASLLSERSFEMARAAGAIVDKQRVLVRLTNASGAPMPVRGVYSIKLNILGSTVVAPFVVCPGLPQQGILGINVIRAFGIMLDTETNRLFFRNGAAGVRQAPIAAMPMARTWSTPPATAEKGLVGGQLSVAAETLIPPTRRG